MEKHLFLPRFSALFLAMSLLLPPSLAQALRIEQPELNTGVEEIARALGPASGMEEIIQMEMPELGLKAAGGKQRGRRPKLEDVYQIVPLVKEGIPVALLAVAADGMGGSGDGERAAKMAAKSVALLLQNENVLRFLKVFKDSYEALTEMAQDEMEEDMKVILRLVFKETHQALFSENHRMGTTLALVLIVGKRAFVASVGDTRVYLLHQERLILLTRDHNVAWERAQAHLEQTRKKLAEPIEIAVEARAYHTPDPDRKTNWNQLTRCLGTREDPFDPEIQSVNLQPGSRLLAMTDGSYEALEGLEEEERLRSKGEGPREGDLIKGLAAGKPGGNLTQTVQGFMDETARIATDNQLVLLLEVSGISAAGAEEFSEDTIRREAEAGGRVLWGAERLRQARPPVSGEGPNQRGPPILFQAKWLGALYPPMEEPLMARIGAVEVTEEDLLRLSLNAPTKPAWFTGETPIPDALYRAVRALGEERIGKLRQAWFVLVRYKLPSGIDPGVPPRENRSFPEDPWKALMLLQKALRSDILMIDHSRKKTSSAMDKAIDHFYNYPQVDPKIILYGPGDPAGKEPVIPAGAPSGPALFLINPNGQFFRRSPFDKTGSLADPTPQIHATDPELTGRLAAKALGFYDARFSAGTEESSSRVKEPPKRPVTFRPLASSDLPSVVALSDQWDDEQTRVGPRDMEETLAIARSSGNRSIRMRLQPFLDAEKTSEGIARRPRFLDVVAAVVAVDAAGRIVGYAYAIVRSDETKNQGVSIEISQVYLRPELRRNGDGKALWSAILRQVALIPNLRAIEVTDGSAGATWKILEKFGFQKEGRFAADELDNTSTQPILKLDLALPGAQEELLRKLSPAAGTEEEVPIPWILDQRVDIQRFPKPGVDIAGGSQIGKRDQQEDFYGTGAGSGAVWAVVADGMGGRPDGELASRMAVERLLLLTQGDAVGGRLSLADPRILVKLARNLRRVNAQMQALNRWMGTTVVQSVIVGNKLFGAWAGDSRLYLLREGRLRLLSKDDSAAWINGNAMILGNTNEEKAKIARDYRERNKEHRITQNLGMDRRHFQPHGLVQELQPGDRILLLSDGAWEPAEEQEGTLENILNSAGTPQEAVAAILAEAEKNKGRDNRTAVVIDYSGPAPVQQEELLPTYEQITLDIQGALTRLPVGGLLFNGLTVIRPGEDVQFAMDLLPPKMVLDVLKEGCSRLALPVPEQQYAGEIYLERGISLRPDVAAVLGDRVRRLPERPEDWEGFFQREEMESPFVVIDDPSRTRTGALPPAARILNLPATLAGELSMAQWAALDAALRRHGSLPRLNGLIERDWAGELDVFDLSV